MRLINADKLIRALKRLAADAALEGRFEDLGEVSDAIYEVRKQPTAYDLDRVLERLRGNTVEFELYDLIAVGVLVVVTGVLIWTMRY